MQWVVSTNIDHRFQDKWLVLDSLNSLNYLMSLRSAIFRIANRVSNKKDRIEVYKVNVKKQNGISVSGIFALA